MDTLTSQQAVYWESSLDVVRSDLLRLRQMLVTYRVCMALLLGDAFAIILPAVSRHSWNHSAITAHAERFSEGFFIEALRELS